MIKDFTESSRDLIPREIGSFIVGRVCIKGEMSQHWMERSVCGYPKWNHRARGSASSCVLISREIGYFIFDSVCMKGQMAQLWVQRSEAVWKRLGTYNYCSNCLVFTRCSEHSAIWSKIPSTLILSTSDLSKGEHCFTRCPTIIVNRFLYKESLTD